MHVSQHQPASGEPTGGERSAAPTIDTASGPPRGGDTTSAAPVTRSLYVPIRRGPAGSVVLLWRTPFGNRTAVAFTSDQRLRSVLGPAQPWIRLSAAALRRMAEPLGALHLTVDPVLTARQPATWAAAPAPAEPLGSRIEPAPHAPHQQQPAASAP
ncbi:SAV_915 family protein [Streptomyces polygonati]|uniref:SAV_915 family protein n=1 Tax=Streptomyces polygonati TaxID=1617087 RepID=A0ABV8HGS8_9ACTN